MEEQFEADSNMSDLLKMTKHVVMKIKQQTKEIVQ